MDSAVEGTPRYYGLCAIGGMLSAGTTHLAITPLDVLKVNMQVHPIKYYSISSCFTTILREQGPSALWRGWAGKFFGYGAQGGCRFGLYEYFKGLYSNITGDCNRSVVYFVSSASAEVFANIALCPFEAVKVRVQAQPCFAKGLFDGFPKLYASEGAQGFYRGLIPLWGRNLPCNFKSLEMAFNAIEQYFFMSSILGYISIVMHLLAGITTWNEPTSDPMSLLWQFDAYTGHVSVVMFSTFEHSVDLLYRKVVRKRKEDCSITQQLGVTCLAGYAAGSVGSLISNPADNIVASLYNRKADSLMLAIRKIGLTNLFTRSLPIRILLVGPSITMQWLFYDTIKVIGGLPTSGEVVTDSGRSKVDQVPVNGMI